MTVQLDDELKEKLGLALTEATLLGVEVLPAERTAGVTFRVLTLPESGPMPEDTRVQFVFEPVGRVAASLRLGKWDDGEAPVQNLVLADVLETVKTFQCPAYGSEFFDAHEKSLGQWGDRLSLDWRSGTDGTGHSISLFQEGNRRHLDLCIWFDVFTIRDAARREIGLEEFVAGGHRWWEGFRAGDPRTASQGLFPLKGLK